MTIKYVKLKECFSHRILGPLLCQHVIRIFKAGLLKKGVKAFPVLIIRGKPGTGKTPIAYAVCIKDNRVTFDMSKKRFTETIQENQIEVIVIDDRAKLETTTGNQHQARMFDLAARLGYSGEGALLIMTAEEKALSNVADSAFMRCIFIDIGEGLSDTQLSSLVTFLQESDILVDFIAETESYLVDNPFDMNKHIKDFRDSHPGPSGAFAKMRDMVALIDGAIRIVSEWFDNIGLGKIDDQIIDGMINGLLEKSASKQMSGEEVLNSIIEHMIFNDFIKPKTCRIGNYCSYFVHNGCQEAMCDMENYDGGCNKILKRVDAYNPNDLILRPAEEKNAILIEYPKLFHYFNHPYSTPPFLIMNSNVFDNAVNMALSDYCFQNKIKLPLYSSITLHKRLFDIYRIMAASNIEKGYRYTFPFLSYASAEDINMRERKSRVIILLLKDNEADYLYSKSKDISEPERARDIMYHMQNLSPRICATFSGAWNQAIHFAGCEIGEKMEIR